MLKLKSVDKKNEIIFSQAFYKTNYKALFYKQEKAYTS